MTGATRFLFDRDFRAPFGRAGGNAQAELDGADARGFARGVVEGRRQAAVEAEALLAQALQRVAQGAAELVAAGDARQGRLEAEAVAFALALARKLAGEAIDQHPLAGIAEAAKAALQHLRGVPHLVARVNDALVEQAETLMKRLAREHGFDGRLVVLGDPDIRPGDARIEWADGGVVRDQARIEAAAAEALATAGLAGIASLDRKRAFATASR
jgi:flagellar assembly protein FliH